MLDNATDDVSIRIWDIPSGRNIQTLRGHTSSVRAIVSLPEGKLITGAMITPFAFGISICLANAERSQGMA